MLLEASHSTHGSVLMALVSHFTNFFTILSHSLQAKGLLMLINNSKA